MNEADKFRQEIFDALTPVYKDLNENDMISALATTNEVLLSEMEKRGGDLATIAAVYGDHILPFFALVAAGIKETKYEF